MSVSQKLLFVFLCGTWLVNRFCFANNQKSSLLVILVEESSWNMMAHSDAQEGKWRETGEWSG